MTIVLTTMGTVDGGNIGLVFFFFFFFLSYRCQAKAHNRRTKYENTGGLKVISWAIRDLLRSHLIMHNTWRGESFSCINRARKFNVFLYETVQKGIYNIHQISVTTSFSKNLKKTQCKKNKMKNLCRHANTCTNKNLFYIRKK